MKILFPVPTFTETSGMSGDRVSQRAVQPYPWMASDKPTDTGEPDKRHSMSAPPPSGFAFKPSCMPFRGKDGVKFSPS